jgi:hypothetical protein
VDILSGSDTLLTFAPDDAIYCEYLIPHKSEKIRGCSFKIQKASKALHEGAWIVDVALSSSMNSIRYVYNVTVHQIGSY